MTMSALSYASIAPLLAEPAGKLIIAYSGGVDSTVLLHLCATQALLRDKIIAVYVHHGLQSAADAWGEHCRQQAAAWAIDFQMLRVNAQANSGESPEAAARNARYHALQGLLQSGDMLLLAQHREDQLETLLLQLFRGAGVQGLAAMPVCQPFGPGKMLRPLLHTAKPAILEYAIQHQLTWVEDPSNQSSDFDRNFLRNQVVPLLKQRWPSLDKTVARSARHCAAAALLIEDWAQQALQPMINPPANSLDISQLRGFGPAQRQELLRHWLSAQGLQAPSQAVLQAIQQQLIDGRDDANPQICLQQHSLKRYRQQLFCLSTGQLQVLPAHCIWPTDQNSLTLTNGSHVSRSVASSGIDQQLWHSQTATLQPRRGGEKIKLPGRAGRHCLKKLYQEAGIPPWERDSRPLLYLNNRLAAVPGLWVDEWVWSSQSDACYQLSWTHGNRV